MLEKHENHENGIATWNEPSKKFDFKSQTQNEIGYS
jgi:hypothetical protein